MITPTIDVTFLSADDGGRNALPSFVVKPCYRTHIVIQEPTTRSPKIDKNGISNEEYLGVQFIDGPSSPEFNVSFRCTLRLMYHPSVDYSAIVNSATFTVREGGRIVGFGTVTSQ